MTSIFQFARQNSEEQPEDVSPVFSIIKKHKEENIIPPIGIAKPELVEAFLQNMEDEEKILEAVRESEEYEKETPFQTKKREVLSHGARLAEGFFGGINSFLNMITPELSESEEGMPYGPGEAPPGLPGPHELHEFTKEKTGKYLEPKTEKAKATQEIASDIGSMFSTPGLGFLQKILLPIGGQAVKQIVKESGGSEKAQDYGKLGFMSLASIARLGNAPRIAGQALTQAEQMIPQGVRFSAQPTQNSLNRIRNSNWYQTGRTPSKGPAMDEIDRIQGQIQNGTIDAHKAMQLRRDINEARKQLGGFQLNKPVNKKQALRYLDEADRALLDSMENYGNRVNPQWYRNYTLANEAYRVTERSRLISDFIERHARPLQSDAAKILFHTGVAVTGLKLPMLGLGLIPAAGAGKTIQIMNRMIRSPVLRNHYLNVLQTASVGNAAAMQKALDKFDRAAKMEEEKFKKQSNRQNHQD